VKPARRQVRRLHAASRLLPRAVRVLDPLAASLRSSGALEALQTFIYYTALSTSRFDRISHIVPAYVIFNDCLTWARTPTPGCDAHFGGKAVGASGARTKRRRVSRPRRRVRRRSAPRQTPAPAPAPPAPAAPGQNGVPTVPRPGLPQLPRGSDPVQPLLDYLLAP
jgi:hypothetical protein